MPEPRKGCSTQLSPLLAWRIANQFPPCYICVSVSLKGTFNTFIPFGIKWPLTVVKYKALWLPLDIMRNFRHPPRSRSHLRCSGNFVAYSGNSLPTFRDNLSLRSWRVKDPKSFFLFLTLQGGTDRLSRNVGNEFPLYAAWCLRKAQKWAVAFHIGLNKNVYCDRLVGTDAFFLSLCVIRNFPWWTFKLRSPGLHHCAGKCGRFGEFWRPVPEDGDCTLRCVVITNVTIWGEKNLWHGQ